MENELSYCRKCHALTGEKRKIGKKKCFNSNSKKKCKTGN